MNNTIKILLAINDYKSHGSITLKQGRYGD
jgi:hypothetical protein